MAATMASAARRPHAASRLPAARQLYGMPFHDLAPDEALALILERDPSASFAYVVTPNVDHVVRLHRSPHEVRRYYQDAWLSLCDSAVLAFLSLTAGRRLQLVAGSDLVEALFARLDPTDRLLVIGCEPSAISALEQRYGLRDIAHHNPAMGFADDPAELQACVDFAVSHPARFVFLAVGSPRQEMLAQRLRQSGAVRGIGLCVGSSLRFLAGDERRAPRALRGSGFEWLFRLVHDPRRLWRRYLVDGPVIFRIAAREALASISRRRDGREDGTR
jgi:N-acetylglucosaminyldiphosphoundecaprenol N-acetyl-beta-D-mannosaminyltransferase